MRLQTKLLLLVIPLVVLPLAWLGWIAYGKLLDNSRETTLAQMHTLLDQVSRSTSAHLTTARANIELFAGSNLVRHYILTRDETVRYTLLQPRLMRLFASYQRAYPDYYELRIILPDGYEDTRSTLAALPNKTEIEVDWEFFEQLRAAEEAVVERYTRNPDNGKPVLYLGKRLAMRDESFEAAGTPPTLRGYLVISIDMEFLQEHLDTQRIGRHGYLLATDGSGHPFMTPQGRTIPPFGKETYAQLQQTTPTHQANKTDYNGYPSFVHGHTLHRSLQLYAVLPEADLLADSRTLGILVANVTLLTIVLAGSLIFFVINRILIRPIRKLAQMADNLGHGRFDTRTGIATRDEIGDLARSFEKMGRNLQESQDRVTYFAYHDALTGLPNRRMFQEHLQRALAHAQRHHARLALLFLDLDDFKRVNDTKGHQAGDQLLQDLSERLRECLRAEDHLSVHKGGESDAEPQSTLSRVGGDEFLILLHSIKDTNDPAVVARRLLDLLSEPFHIGENDFFVGGSIGITLYPTDGDDVQTLIKNADIAMYHAKRHGRNNCQYFNESMNAAAVERMTMENALRDAIHNGEFLLHFQPKVDTRSGEIKGVEALIRWQHPTMGMIPPGKFIPFAEDTNLIVPIGEWVIDEATRQMTIWQEDGIDLSMSVNISSVQLSKQNVVEVIKRYIEKNRCRPDRLEIELTETSIMKAHERASGMLGEIKSLGVQVSMDDFGTGYSSFTYLRNLPIDILKIDRSFIRDITTDRSNAAIFSAILSMAHTLELVVVAEGVETLEQLQFLRDQRTDIVQGYLISQPLPESELRTFIADRKKLHIFDTDAAQ